MILPGKHRRILWYETLGCLLLIAVSWLDESLDFTYVVFGGTPNTTSWRESAMDTSVVTSVWAAIFFSTRRMLKRLHYLEGFLPVCAWCRKVGSGDEWISIEEYFSRNFDVRSSHGMCPECQEKVISQMDGQSPSSPSNT